MDKSEIRKAIENYKMIIAHLDEHIKEGNFDNLDVKQSKILKKEIKRLKNKTNKDDLIPANKVSKDDDLYKYSNPRIAQEKAFDYLGNTAIIYKSIKPKKKFMIYDPNNNKWVYFGQMNPPMEDYNKHKDDERMMRYRKRAMNMKGNWKDNPYSANNLSINILW